MSSAPDNWFALVDTARDPRLHGLVTQCARWQCLMSGRIAPVLAATLPYLVQLQGDEPLLEAWRAHGAGNAWGYTFQSPLRIEQLRGQFKKFINATLPDGMVVLFRFYDPRVFRTYVATLEPHEAEPWFRDISRYVVESSEPGRYHDFQLRDGRLHDGGKPVERGAVPA